MPMFDEDLQVIRRPAASVGSVRVTASASVVTLAAQNTSRNFLSVYNDSNKMLYVKLGPGASAVDYTVALDSFGGYYEMPVLYQGDVTGIWSSGATGGAQIMEVI